MNTAVVSVGSNINPIENIETAKKKISREFKFISSSSFKETKPIGFKNQDDFYNGAFLLQTDKELDEVNMLLKKIEVDIGRVKTSNKQGPREIDLDIIILNNVVVDNDVYERKFLQNSVLELLPGFVF